MTIGWILGAALIGPVVVSYVVEALRRSPRSPDHLAWAPNMPIRYLSLDGVRIRYVASGDGPLLVLLHTLRTQLDLFQKVLPELARHYRVYALDFPGHGWSDIPPVPYSPELFVRTVAQFLERLDLNHATLVGESIGGSVALLLAARRNPRVARVVAINPYDYDRGRGLRRSSALANLIFGVAPVPIVGPTVMRLRNRVINGRILRGGAHQSHAIPPAFAREAHLVGNRPGHYRALLSLVGHWRLWEAARSEYPRIDRPVLLLYGEHDWSRVGEREANGRIIPGAELRVVSSAGHFLSLDAPEEMIRTVSDFIARTDTESQSTQTRGVLS